MFSLLCYYWLLVNWFLYFSTDGCINKSLTYLLTYLLMPRNIQYSHRLSSTVKTSHLNIKTNICDILYTPSVILCANILKFIIIVFNYASATLKLHAVYFEPLISSSTIQNLHFPELFTTSSCNFEDFPRTKLIFHHFPGPGKSSTFQDVWEPCRKKGKGEHLL